MSEFATTEIEFNALVEERNFLQNQLVSKQHEVAELSQQVNELESEFYSLEAQYSNSQENEDLFSRIFHQSPSHMVVVDSKGMIIDANCAAQQLLNISLSKTPVLSLRSLLAKDQFHLLLKAMLKFSRHGYCDDFLIIDLDDEVSFHPKFLLLEDIQPGLAFSPPCFLMSIKTFDFNNKNTNALRLSGLALDQLSEGVMITDEKRKVIMVNQAFSEITGYREDEILGKTPGELSSGRHHKKFYDTMWDTLNSSGRWQGEIFNKTKNGDVFPEWLQISRIVDKSSNKVFYIAVFSDITERKQRQKELDQLAYFDSLTGLPNRQAFFGQLENVINRANLSNSKFALLFIDLDMFKEVNDNFGHHEGDRVLKIATQRLVACIRDNDFTARLGGDEFVIVLGRIQDIEDVLPVANNLIEALGYPFQVNNNKHQLSASIGIALFPDHAKAPNELLRKADLAMYAAKNKGKNRFYIYDHDLEVINNSEHIMLENLKKACNDPNAFIEMHYQPIVQNINDAKSHEYECLVRLNIDGNLVYPDQFIGLAESNNLIADLGLAIFKKVCIDINNEGLCDSVFAVNLSPLQFVEGNLIDSLKEITRAYDVDLAQFNFEITETAVIQNLHQIEDSLITLKSFGCNILLDDFGTGYASLSVLKSLPVDIVKIDRSFITELPSNETKAMLKAMSSMCKSLKLSVLCEGVETEGQYQWLEKLEVDYYQGYLFSKPKPITDFITAND